MLKRVFLIFICSGLQAQLTPASCTCLLNKSIDHICYVGNLDLNLKSNDEQPSLYYDGNIIKANNGIYCFKEHKNIKKLYFLFINPEAIRFRSDHNGSNSYLTFDDTTPYEFYRIKQIKSSNVDNESFIDWNTKQKPMPKEQKNNALQVVIPEHTIIIPLNAEYFMHKNKEIIFDYQPLKDKHAVVKLPSPQYKTATSHDKLIESLLQANLCIMNLKNIHSPQEIKKIRMDGHTLMQEAS